MPLAQVRGQRSAPGLWLGHTRQPEPALDPQAKPGPARPRSLACRVWEATSTGPSSVSAAEGHGHGSGLQGRLSPQVAPVMVRRCPALHLKSDAGQHPTIIVTTVFPQIRKGNHQT